MLPAQISDIEIWDAFRAGDVEAFMELRLRFVKRLFRYGYKITGNSALAKEVSIDFFVDLYIKRESLGPTPSPTNYLYLAYRRRLFARLEKDKRFSGPELLLDKLNDYPTPDNIIIRQETEQALQLKVKQAMNALTSRQREVIHLKYFEEMSYEEIAKLMELNPQSAYNLIHRSLKALRDIISEMPIDGYTRKLTMLLSIWYQL